MPGAFLACLTQGFLATLNQPGRSAERPAKFTVRHKAVPLYFPPPREAAQEFGRILRQGLFAFAFRIRGRALGLPFTRKTRAKFPCLAFQR